MKNLFSVKDKVVIVTGAKGGNGSAISSGLERAGAGYSDKSRFTKI